MRKYELILADSVINSQTDDFFVQSQVTIGKKKIANLNPIAKKPLEQHQNIPKIGLRINRYKAIIDLKVFNNKPTRDSTKIRFQTQTKFS